MFEPHLSTIESHIETQIGKLKEAQAKGNSKETKQAGKELEKAFNALNRFALAHYRFLGQIWQRLVAARPAFLAEHGIERGAVDQAGKFLDRNLKLLQLISNNSLEAAKEASDPQTIGKAVERYHGQGLELGSLGIKPFITETRLEAKREAQMLDAWLRGFISNARLKPDDKTREEAAILKKEEDELKKLG